MIVKINLTSKEGKNDTILFGNSYKNWRDQFNEFCQFHRPIKVVFVETSKADWIGWGGLKWCAESDFQGELSREGCQSKDPDNPKPRLYAAMKFIPNQIIFNQANKILNDRLLAFERYQAKVKNEAKPDYSLNV